MRRALEPVKQQFSSLIRDMRSRADAFRIRLERSPEQTCRTAPEFIADIRASMDEIQALCTPLLEIEYEVNDSVFKDLVESRITRLEKRNRILHDELLRRKRLEKEHQGLLHDSIVQNRFLNTITDTTTTGIAIVRADDFVVTWANAAMVRFMGEQFKASGIIGRTLEQIIPGAKEISLIEHCRQVIATRKPRIDNEVFYTGFQTGANYWKRILSPLPRDGQVDIVLQLEDITDHVEARKRLEVLAAEHEKQRTMLDLIMERAPIGIAFLDSSGRYVLVNQALAALNRMPVEEHIGKTVFDVIPDMAPIVQGLLNYVLTTGRTIVDYEIADSTRSGENHRFGLASFYPVFDQGKGISGVGVIINDITARKRTEIDLVRKQQFTRTILDSIPANFAVVNRTGSIIEVSQSWEKFAGRYDCKLIECGLGINYLDVCLRAIPSCPEAKKAYNGISAVLSGTAQSYDLEYTLDLDGEMHAFLMRVVPLALDHGGALIAHIDITERQKLETALRNSETRFRSLVEATSDWIWEVDSQGRYTYASPKIRDLLGYTPEEVIGKTPFDFMPKSEAERVRKIFSSFCESGQSFSGIENINIHKNGTPVVLETSGVAVFDHAETCIGYRGIDRDITERKKQQEQLRLSEERLRLAVEAAQLGIWDYDLATENVNWSDRVFEIYGVPKGTPMTQRKFYAFVHPDDLPMVRHAVESSLTQDKGFYQCDFRILRPDGVIRWTTERGHVIAEATDNTLVIKRLIGTTLDITERKRAELELAAAKDAAELRAREAYEAKTILDALMEQVPEGIIIADAPSLKVRMVSAHATTMTGLDRATLADMSIGKLTHNWRVLRADTNQVLHADDMPLISAAKKGSVVTNLELVIESPDGGRIFILCNSGPLRYIDGSINGAALVFTDITERKKAQHKLEEFRDMLEQKNRELESILGTASHDLRSPLSNITGFSSELVRTVSQIDDLLKPADLPKAMRRKIEPLFESDIPEAINFIKNSAATIDQILNGLLRVARAGLGSLNLQKLDINRIFSRIVSNIEYRLKQTHAVIAVDDLPPCTGDPDQVLQIFTNLIDNAVKYLDPARPGLIHVHGSVQGDRARYVVEDNGRGIAPQHIDKLFELFFRVEPGKVAGEGLGLTIIRRMVDRHNGRIWVESELGKGSRFYVELPI